MIDSVIKNTNGIITFLKIYSQNDEKLLDRIYKIWKKKLETVILTIKLISDKLNSRTTDCANMCRVLFKKNMFFTGGKQI